jgi:hypothetical protein
MSELRLKQPLVEQDLSKHKAIAMPTGRHRPAHGHTTVGP